MNWFEEWFDSPLYDLLYANRNEEEAARLVELVESIIPKPTYTRILDLGCGRGRHSLTLAEKGYQVTGIDQAEEAIRKAREKAEARGLENVTFRVGDMRDPLPGEFDAVFNLFTSFGYFEDDEENLKVFSSVHQMLRRGGIFMIDYLNADWVRSNYEPEGSGEFREISYQIRRYIENDMVHKRITFEGEEMQEPKVYTERVKLYDLEWFLEQFHRAGFEIEKIFGDYHGGSFNPESSTRLLMVVRKK